jgi:hypothetical protein
MTEVIYVATAGDTGEILGAFISLVPPMEKPRVQQSQYGG